MIKMQIVIATENLHKLNELQAILPSSFPDGSSIIYTGMQSFSLTLPPETGTSLQENAQLKAVYVARQTGLPAISDDTGLEVDFLNGAPGIYTARYAGEHGNAQANNQKLLAALKDVPMPQRTARFRTVACLAYPNGKTVLFEGTAEGHIAQSYSGKNGFGYDPIFIVTATNKTFAQMSPEEKNALSHRARAFKKLAQYVKENPTF